MVQKTKEEDSFGKQEGKTMGEKLPLGKKKTKRTPISVPQLRL